MMNASFPDAAPINLLRTTSSGKEAMTDPFKRSSLTGEAGKEALKVARKEAGKEASRGASTATSGVHAGLRTASLLVLAVQPRDGTPAASSATTTSTGAPKTPFGWWMTLVPTPT
ncbi:Hypothetical protein NocV09_10300040 [Nannochloropsis oceanica]